NPVDSFLRVNSMSLVRWPSTLITRKIAEAAAKKHFSPILTRQSFLFRQYFALRRHVPGPGSACCFHPSQDHATRGPVSQCPFADLCFCGFTPRLLDLFVSNYNVTSCHIFLARNDFFL